MNIKHMISATVITTLLLLNTSWIFAAEDKKKDEPEAAQKQATLTKLEKKFQELMTNATLVGHFTIEGEKGKKPAADKYTLGKVTKLKGDNWQFAARIQYLDRDVSITLPPIQVKWAGDTPVISVTNVGVPILGTYSARVLIYDGFYAGTWSGKDHGGLMYGKIVKATEKKKEESKKE